MSRFSLELSSSSDSAIRSNSSAVDILDYLQILVFFLAMKQLFSHFSLKLLPLLLATPITLLLVDRLTVIHVGCMALWVRATHILVLIPTLFSVLGVTLVRVLLLAMLLIGCRTVRLVMFLPYDVALLFFLPELL